MKNENEKVIEQFLTQSIEAEFKDAPLSKIIRQDFQNALRPNDEVKYEQSSSSSNLTNRNLGDEHLNLPRKKSLNQNL